MDRGKCDTIAVKITRWRDEVKEVPIDEVK
jgi:hypothetical protein